MRFELTPVFERDWRRLSEDERVRFRAVIKERFHAVCQRSAANPAHPWPRSLRVKSVGGARGVCEMTWSFAGPDGRATFEWLIVDGEPRVRWRRIGGHAIFGEP